MLKINGEETKTGIFTRQTPMVLLVWRLGKNNSGFLVKKSTNEAKTDHQHPSLSNSFPVLVENNLAVENYTS